MSSHGTVRRWSTLAIALTATLCTTIFTSGVAFLIATLHTERHLDWHSWLLCKASRRDLGSTRAKV